MQTNLAALETLPKDVPDQHTTTIAQTWLDPKQRVHRILTDFEPGQLALL